MQRRAAEAARALGDQRRARKLFQVLRGLRLTRGQRVGRLARLAHALGRASHLAIEVCLGVGQPLGVDARLAQLPAQLAHSVALSTVFLSQLRTALPGALEGIRELLGRGGGRAELPTQGGRSLASGVQRRAGLAESLLETRQAVNGAALLAQRPQLRLGRGDALCELARRAADLGSRAGKAVFGPDLDRYAQIRH